MGVWKETKRLVRYKVAENRAQEAALYAQVMEELEQGNRDKGLWGKALAETEGNEAKANAKYMKLRVQALVDLLNVGADMAERAEENIAKRADWPAPDKAREKELDRMAAQKSEQMAAQEKWEAKLKGRKSDHVRSLEKLANALTKLRIYASRGTDGTWRVYLPDGTVWIADDDSAFHDYAKRAFREKSDPI